MISKPKIPAEAASDWRELVRVADGEEFFIERISVPARQIAVEGHFALPELARLAADDQVFVAAFVRTHGSIKAMEQLFGVSYPTIKARLNRISEQLSFVEPATVDERAEILARLSRGEINAAQAAEQLEALR